MDASVAVGACRAANWFQGGRDCAEVPETLAGVIAIVTHHMSACAFDGKKVWVRSVQIRARTTFGKS
jgi:hypothetical protein